MPQRDQFRSEEDWLEHLRLYFAGQALVGVAGAIHRNRQEAINNCATDAAWEAALTYALADAMLATRTALSAARGEGG